MNSRLDPEVTMQSLDGSNNLFQMNCAAPEVDLNRVLKTYGYKDPAKVPAKVRLGAIEAIEIARGLAIPQSYMTVAAIRSLEKGMIVLEDNTIFTCPAFDRNLAGCDAVCIFVTTLGDKIDKRIQQCFGDDFQPLHALCIGTSGWLMIESVTRLFMIHLKEHFSHQDKTLTMRMGPGYSYPHGKGKRVSWDLSEQHQLFSLFADIDLPITLTKGFSMQPSMSRSGMAGLRSPKAC